MSKSDEIKPYVIQDYSAGFIEGYTQALPKWVDVKEKLPKKSICCFILDSENNVFEGVFFCSKKRRYFTTIKKKDVIKGEIVKYAEFIKPLPPTIPNP